MGPNSFIINVHVSVIILEAVFIALPKALAVIHSEPVSFRKYNVTANFLSALTAQLLGLFGFGAIKGCNLSTSSKKDSFAILVFFPGFLWRYAI